MKTKLMRYTAALVMVLLALFLGLPESRAVDGPAAGVNYNVPNWAISPLPTVVGGVVTPGTGMQKFLDKLPGLGVGNKNLLNQYIPVATPSTPPGSPAWAATDDYYEIALVEYVEQMHSNLPPVVGSKLTGTGGTKIRGYVQEINGTPVGDPHYLGPMILATKNKPVRVKFTNRLPAGPQGNLFIPMDSTLMGAGSYTIDVDPTNPGGATLSGTFNQNRASLHLHGGNTPWISDGTPHQWVVPAADYAGNNYPKGMAVQPVPDMDLPPNGSLTFYFTNQQSGRLMFYHDHCLGITRLNVYTGAAAGYLVTDTAERALTNGGTVGIPNMPEVPLIIQDKTFVPDAAQLAATDPLWDTAAYGTKGNFWFPHVYMPNQWPGNPDNSGSSPMGRWDYGPWFWPIFPAPNAIPALSHVPESFLDTPVINGTAYPYMDAPAGPVRLRILNASNDRYWNLQFYVTSNILSGITLGSAGTGYTAAPGVTITPATGDTTGHGATATATVDLVAGSPTLGQITGITLDTVGSGYTLAPTVTITPAAGDVTGTGATATAGIYTAATEVGMVPYNPPQATWPTGWGVADGRIGGVPDPLTRGPAMIQIGTEGGILPYPAVINNIPINYDYDRRSITVLNVLEHGLFLGPAERADVIVDFTPYAGKTLILYNDSPAPVPAGDPRNDYYTLGPDNSASGGAPSVLPGYGPNTRTMMKINVAGTAGAALPTDYVNPTILAALQTALPAAYALTQDRPIVAESAYNAAFGTAWTDQYARIYTGSATQPTFDFTDGNGNPASFTPGSKAIQELFDTYGRMNSTLGVELPATSALIQTTIPLGYVDPPTEKFTDGETQVWKITHNGVDTHAVHFHLFNVQVINRVGWDGMIKPPDANELGWKETVRMNPLEDVIVAMKAKSQTLPFAVPDSIRPYDVTMPIGTTGNLTQIDPLTGNPATITNAMHNFHWEYVWHCHLLGHEENDMMRAIEMTVGAAGATVGITPASLTFASQAVGTTSAAQTITLSNSGAAALTINSITVTGANAADFIKTTTCGASLAAPTAPATSTTCTISVSFKPTATGARAAAITVSNSDVANPTLTVGLTGTGTAAPAAAITPASLTFANQAVNTTSAAQTITLSNTGTGALTISGIAVTGANAGDFAQTSTCTGTLAAPVAPATSTSCTISVTFKPTAVGARAGAVTVTSNDPTNPTLNVALTGTGLAAPVASLSPLTMTFTSQAVNTTSAAQTITLSNSGSAPLTISSIAIAGTNTADFAQTTTCGGTLAVPVAPATATSCTISVTFRPTSAGAKTANITVNTNDPVNPTLSVALTGAGQTPVASISPLGLTFANQYTNTTSAAQAITFANSGTGPLTIYAIGLNGANTADFAQTTTCGSVLAAPVAPATSTTCTISVTFTPTAAGARTASIIVASDDPASPSLTVSLNGTGVIPGASLSPTSLTFASQAINTWSAVQTVRLTNLGATRLTGIRVSFTGANATSFRIAGSSCGTALTAGASCTIGVRFRPTVAGALTGVLSVTSSDPSSPQTVQLSGTGTGPTNSVSPTSIAFGPWPVAGGATAPQTVTVTNTGTAALILTGVNLGGANANQFARTNVNCPIRGTGLAPGASCTVNITFNPSRVGAKTARLAVTAAAPAASVNVALTGTGQ